MVASAAAWPVPPARAPSIAAAGLAVPPPAVATVSAAAEPLRAEGGSVALAAEPPTAASPVPCSRALLPSTSFQLAPPTSSMPALMAVTICTMASYSCLVKGPAWGLRAHLHSRRAKWQRPGGGARNGQYAPSPQQGWVPGRVAEPACRAWLPPLGAGPASMHMTTSRHPHAVRLMGERSLNAKRSSAA